MGELQLCMDDRRHWKIFCVQYYCCSIRSNCDLNPVVFGWICACKARYTKGRYGDDYHLYADHASVRVSADAHVPYDQ